MLQKNKDATKISLWGLAVIFWMAVIFYFSSRPGYGQYQFNMQVFLERKGAHVAEFFILTMLVLQLMKVKGLLNERMNYFWAAFFSLVYAASDEFHQLFVPARDGKMQDVLIDGVGIMIAVVAFQLIFRCRKKQ